MQPAHALHLFRIPDRRERLLADSTHWLAIEHVTLAARIDVAILFDVHWPAPQVVTRMLPLASGVPGVGTHQVGLVFLDAKLVDSRDRTPEPDEVVDLVCVALHPHHLDHNLQFGPALMLELRKTDEVITHFLE